MPYKKFNPGNDQENISEKIIWSDDPQIVLLDKKKIIIFKVVISEDLKRLIVQIADHRILGSDALDWKMVEKPDAVRVEIFEITKLITQNRTKKSIICELADGLVL